MAYLLIVIANLLDASPESLGYFTLWLTRSSIYETASITVSATPDENLSLKCLFPQMLKFFNLVQRQPGAGALIEAYETGSVINEVTRIFCFVEE